MVVVTGVTVPAPSSVILTRVALLKVLPLTVIGVVPQVLPPVLLRIIEGIAAQPHETANDPPVLEHPAAFLTVIV